MPDDHPKTEVLLQAAVAGDQAALGRLLERHRPSLRRTVAARVDARTANRLDPSDILQEAFTDAWRKLNAYARDRPLPFYPWLRRLVVEKYLQARRRILAKRRTPAREESAGPVEVGESAWLLAERLAGSDTSPSRRLIAEEMKHKLLEALGRLAPADRQVLVLRYLEDLPFFEVAAVLGINENAAKVRHFRALLRIREVLDIAEPRE